MMTPPRWNSQPGVEVTLGVTVIWDKRSEGNFRGRVAMREAGCTVLNCRPQPRWRARSLWSQSPQIRKKEESETGFQL